MYFVIINEGTGKKGDSYSVKIFNNLSEAYSYIIKNELLASAKIAKEVNMDKLMESINELV